MNSNCYETASNQWRSRRKIFEAISLCGAPLLAALVAVPALTFGGDVYVHRRTHPAGAALAGRRPSCL